MEDNGMKIEERIKNMRNVYMKIGEIIDKIPDAISEDVKEKLKFAILGDAKLKELMEGIEEHRPPRIFLIGRTGVGKSSLINALCNKYVATVSDTTSCTKDLQKYKCMDGNRVLMEICDTRGISESVSLNETISAEEMLIKQVNEFSPDVAIFMLGCTHRDDVTSDVEFLKKLTKAYEKENNLRLPVIVAINKCDEMAPSRIKEPTEYTESKIAKIQEMVSFYKGIIVKQGLKIDGIVSVSSLLEWKTADGLEIDVQDIENLPENDKENLQISFDGRYDIENLRKTIDDNIQDYKARMGFRMAAKLSEVIKRISNQLTKTFAGIASAIATAAIFPVSDIIPLSILQTILVFLIASLSGRDVTWDSVREFIASLLGVTAAGVTFRQIAKMLVPIFGSLISGGIAFGGTYAIGKAAIAYYIDEKNLEEAKEVFNKEKNKKQEE